MLILIIFKHKKSIPFYSVNQYHYLLIKAFYNSE